MPPPGFHESQDSKPRRRRIFPLTLVTIGEELPQCSWHLQWGLHTGRRMLSREDKKSVHAPHELFLDVIYGSHCNDSVSTTTFGSPLPNRVPKHQLQTWRLLTQILSLPAGLGVLFIFMMYESPKFLASQNKEDEALYILSRIYSINTGKSEEYYLTGLTTEFEPVFADSLEDNTLFTIMAMYMAASFLNLIVSFIPSKKASCISVLIVCGVCYFLTNLAQNFKANILFFLICQIAGVAMCILAAFYVELYPTTNRGMAASLGNMFGRMFSFLGVTVIGITIKEHCTATIYAWGALLISAAVILYFLPKESRNNHR